MTYLLDYIKGNIDVVLNVKQIFSWKNHMMMTVSFTYTLGD